MTVKKIFSVVTACLALATTFAFGQTWTQSTIQNVNGIDYELWSQDNKGNFNMKITGGSNDPNGGTFEGTWTNTHNVLFRAGKKWGSSSNTTARDVGNISIDFEATWNSTDNVKILGVYGWAYYPQGSVPNNFTNQIEYYIIQDRGSYNTAQNATNAQKKGEGTIDGILYEFWVGDRLNQPNLTGNGNFKQYFSVPKNTSDHRVKGKISVSKHFDAWDKAGMKMMDCPLYEVAMKVESYSGNNPSNGSTKVTKNILTLGGSGGGDDFYLTTKASPNGGGTITKSPNESYYAPNAKVQLTATPNSGWEFVGWEGDASGSNASTSVTMTKDRNVTAKFQLIPGAESNVSVIEDGTFPTGSISTDDGTAWKLGQGEHWGGSTATATVSGGTATINVAKIGEQSYQPQLVQYGLPLDEGVSYKLSFTARAAAARTIEASFQEAVDPWTGYGSKEFEIGTIDQEYEYIFTMENPSDASAQFAFNLGQATGNVYISDVKLVHTSGGTTIVGSKIKHNTPEISVQNRVLNIISPTGADLKVRMVGINGKVHANFSVNQETSFSLAEMPAGLYYIDVKGSGMSQTKAIILE